MSATPASPPRHVLLFSGHMVDAPGRATPRFTPAMVPAARARIEQVLDALQAGPQDLALSQAAAGGDLLFLAACMARGVRCQVLLPQPEPAFVAASVLPSADGPAWLRQWQALRPQLASAPQVLPDEPAAPGSIHERCNQWLLASALAQARGPLQLLLLWDGGGGDGPGGTRHMKDVAQRQGAQLHWIDTRRL